MLHVVLLLAAAAFRTMVGVIAHCHNMGVMHRDIKAGGSPANWGSCTTWRMHAVVMCAGCCCLQPENFLLTDKSKDAELRATE
jgi:serine/threonine protein kinase